MTCPRCGSENIAEVVYGLPTADLGEAADRGEVVLGGCEPQEATHACRRCGLRWDWSRVSRA
jgi:transcription elongation factor Elf1